MLTPNQLEELCIRNSRKEMIMFCMENNFIRREVYCDLCNTSMNLVPYKKVRDEFAWRCMHKACVKYKEYCSIRKDSFFNNFKNPISLILRIISKYSVRQPQFSIILSLDISKKSIQNILSKLKELMPPPNFTNNKLGGPNSIVQVDETALNYKVKSHRGRSPTNRTDSLCIVEVRSSITRAFATVIPNKKASTIIPIICSQVASNSTIYTDEHGAYCRLNAHEYVHETVCHKYEFVNSLNGVNTQAIESFNNELKLEIKRRKGIKTNERCDFLKEFCFYFNNRSNFFIACLDLIKL